MDNKTEQIGKGKTNRNDILQACEESLKAKNQMRAQKVHSRVLESV